MSTGHPDYPMMPPKYRYHIETIVRHQVEQHYCTWPGGPGCERLGTRGECCGAVGWRTLREIRTEGAQDV